MIIHDLNIICTCLLPTKTDAPLIVDPNTVLPGPISFECFKTVSGRYSQIFQTARNLKLSQLPSCHCCDTRKPSHANALCKGFGFGRLE